jgi:hypothetical protein
MFRGAHGVLHYQHARLAFQKATLYLAYRRAILGLSQALLITVIALVVSRRRPHFTCLMSTDPTELGEDRLVGLISLITTDR